MDDQKKVQDTEIDQSNKVVDLWPQRTDSLTEFVDRLGPEDITLEEMIGGQVLKKTDSLQIPMIASYVDNVRQTTYRKAEGMAISSVNPLPPGSMWIDVDQRISLRKALSLYGDRLLAFEKTQRETTLDILVLPFRKKSELTLRILVRAK